MNRSLIKAALVAALALAPVCAAAYPAKLTTRPVRQVDDDLVVFDFVTTGSAGRSFYRTVEGKTYELKVQPNGRGSITISRTNTVTPGRESSNIVFNSLDRMFPADEPAANTKWRVAFTANFIWVEVSTSDNEGFDKLPVYSTVAFFGAPDVLYNSLIASPWGSAPTNEYGKLSELMADVKGNYAKWQGYPYALPSAPFLYREPMRTALFAPGDP